MKSSRWVLFYVFYVCVAFFHCSKPWFFLLLSRYNIKYCSLSLCEVLTEHKGWLNTFVVFTQITKVNRSQRHVRMHRPHSSLSNWIVKNAVPFLRAVKIFVHLSPFTVLSICIQYNRITFPIISKPSYLTTNSQTAVERAIVSHHAAIVIAMSQIFAFHSFTWYELFTDRIYGNFLN